MEMMPREESARLSSSNNSKGLGKRYQWKNPSDFLPRTTQKGYGRDTQGRIRLTLFLGRLERVREEIPKEESARLHSSDDLKGL
jgi:hypothetical protein